MSGIKLGCFDSSLKRPACQAPMKNCDTTKNLSVDDYIYIYIYIYIYCHPQIDFICIYYMYIAFLQNNSITDNFNKWRLLFDSNHTRILFFLLNDYTIKIFVIRYYLFVNVTRRKKQFSDELMYPFLLRWIYYRIAIY